MHLTPDCEPNGTKHILIRSSFSHVARSTTQDIREWAVASTMESEAKEERKTRRTHLPNALQDSTFEDDRPNALSRSALRIKSELSPKSDIFSQAHSARKTDATCCLAPEYKYMRTSISRFADILIRGAANSIVTLKWTWSERVFWVNREAKCGPAGNGMKNEKRIARSKANGNGCASLWMAQVAGCDFCVLGANNCAPTATCESI